MYLYIYIRHNGVTVIYKTTEYDSIYDALVNMGYDHASAEDITSWAELASEGEEYLAGNQDEIFIGDGK